MKLPRLLSVLPLLVAGCAANPAPKAATQPALAPTTLPDTILIDNFSYSPQTLTVAPGTAVTWINHDDVPHTVTSDHDPRTLNSPVLDTDGKFTFTFTAPGTYNYYCTVHPHMTAKVIVK